MNSKSTRRWLVLRLEAPLVAFGSVAIDNYGVTGDFPALSMLTGLFANALGYERTESEAHQALQDRLIVASRRDEERYHGVLRDVQNVNMAKSDRSWTTRGTPEGRDGGSYGGPHRRFRDYHPDANVAVVVTLKSPPGTTLPGERLHPTLDDLAHALDRPARPLFIGRKPCLPSSPINAGTVEADTAYTALAQIPALRSHTTSPTRPEHRRLMRAQWPSGEGPIEGSVVSVPDIRNWISGLHGGTRNVVEGRIALVRTVGEAAR